MIQTDLADRAQQLEALARFFLEIPSAETVWAMKSSLPSDVQDPAVSSIAGFLAGVTPETVQEALTEIGVDRTFLLRGTTKQGPVPPYGCLFAGQDANEGILGLKRIYRQAGFQLSEDVHEAADYLGVEMAFAAALLRRMDAAAANGEPAAADAYERFLTRTLRPFAEQYVEQALPFAKTGYCKGVLQMVVDVLDEEAAC